MTLTMYSNGNPSPQCSIGSNCTTGIDSVVKVLLYWAENEISLLAARTQDHITIKGPFYSLDSDVTEAGYGGILTNSDITISNEPYTCI